MRRLRRTGRRWAASGCSRRARCRRRTGQGGVAGHRGCGGGDRGAAVRRRRGDRHPGVLARDRGGRAQCPPWRVQTSLNLAFGSAMASIGLTIPAIAVASIWLDGPLVLGLGPTQMVLLARHRRRRSDDGVAGPGHTPGGGRPSGARHRVRVPGGQPVAVDGQVVMDAGATLPPFGRLFYNQMIEQAAVSATVGFEEFFSDRYRSAARFAFLLTGSGHVAEEIAQDAFLQVFRRWAEIRNPQAYLSRALVSGARSWGRKEHRRPSGQPNRPVEYDSDAITVRNTLWALPERQREALVLRYFLGCIDREIAEAMGCPVGTVKSLIHRRAGQDEGDAEMTNVEDRVERALHVLAERIEPDVAAAERLASRAGSTADPAVFASSGSRSPPPRWPSWELVRCGRSAPARSRRADRPGTRSARFVRGLSGQHRPVNTVLPVVGRATDPSRRRPPGHPNTRAARRARPSARRGADPFRSRPRLGA